MPETPSHWKIDTAHTGVELAVRHMGIFTVRAALGNVQGTVETDNGTLKSFHATIDAATINTNNADRDGHLKSPDFLDVEKYPTIEFQSKEVRAQGQNRYSATGDLTLHGQTHPVTFEVETSAVIQDPFGNQRAGATASGEISRKQWGLVYNQILEAGSLLIGDEVKFTIEVQVIPA